MIDEQVLSTMAPILKMDADVIPYLFPSRYCQSDKLEKLATKEFGYLGNDYGKAAAINDWIYNNVEYLGGFTTSSTSAQDTLTEAMFNLEAAKLNYYRTLGSFEGYFKE